MLRFKGLKIFTYPKITESKNNEYGVCRLVKVPTFDT